MNKEKTSKIYFKDNESLQKAIDIIKKKGYSVVVNVNREIEQVTKQSNKTKKGRIHNE